MATKRTQSKAKSGAEPESTAETQSGPVTMAEALKRLLPLPRYEGSPFKVAEWLDTKHRQGDVGLLGGGVLMPPPTNPAMLGIVARHLSDGRPVLYVQVRSSGFDGVGAMWDCKSLPGLDQHHQHWAFYRTTFEQHFPSALKNRGGRPQKFSRESILIEAAVAAVEIALDEGSLPQPLTLEWLCGTVENRMSAGSPGSTLLKEVLSPLFWRLKDIQDRR